MGMLLLLLLYPIPFHLSRENCKSDGRIHKFFIYSTELTQKVEKIARHPLTIT